MKLSIAMRIALSAKILGIHLQDVPEMTLVEWMKIRKNWLDLRTP